MSEEGQPEPERSSKIDLELDDSWPNAGYGLDEKIDEEDVTLVGEFPRFVKSGKVVSMAELCVVELSAFEPVPTTRGSNSVNSESGSGVSSVAPVLETPSAFCCCPATSSVTALVFVFVVAAAVASFRSFAGVVCVVVSFGGRGGGTT